MSEVVVDPLGRVEIPLSIRELFDLLPGQRLYVETDRDRREIRLSPVTVEELVDPAAEMGTKVIEEEDGFLILDGGAGVDIVALIEQDREERMQKLMKGIPF